MNYKNIFVTCMCLTTAWTILVRAGTNTAFIHAQSVFERSLLGDSSKTNQANSLFDTLSSGEPKNPLYLVYLGSSQTLQARDAWMPWKRMTLVETGLDKVDSALSMLTENHDTQEVRGSIISMETRLVAISTYLKVPDFLNRFVLAKQLFAETIEHLVFNKAAPIVQARIYVQGAVIARKEGNKQQESTYLKKALSYAFTGPHSEAAKLRLIELTE